MPRVEKLRVSTDAALDRMRAAHGADDPTAAALTALAAEARARDARNTGHYMSLWKKLWILIGLLGVFVAFTGYIGVSTLDYHKSADHTAKYAVSLARAIQHGRYTADVQSCRTDRTRNHHLFAREVKYRGLVKGTMAYREEQSLINAGHPALANCVVYARHKAGAGIKKSLLPQAAKQ